MKTHYVASRPAKESGNGATVSCPIYVAACPEDFPDEKMSHFLKGIDLPPGLLRRFIKNICQIEHVEGLVLFMYDDPLDSYPDQNTLYIRQIVNLAKFYLEKKLYVLDEIQQKVAAQFQPIRDWQQETAKLQIKLSGYINSGAENLGDLSPDNIYQRIAEDKEELTNRVLGQEPIKIMAIIFADNQQL